MTAADIAYQSFYSAKKYFDDDNFPYGFDRSGEFTPAQAKFIQQSGLALKELATGVRDPVTEEEQQFLSFCRGDRPANTLAEKTWERYTKVCNRDKHFFTVGDSRSSTANDDYASFDDD